MGLQEFMNGFSNMLANIVNTIIFWDNLENITFYMLIACGVGIFVLFRIIKNIDTKSIVEIQAFIGDIDYRISQGADEKIQVTALLAEIISKMKE